MDIHKYFKSPQMSTLPLNEKYRPSELLNILGNSDVLKALQKISENKEIPHLLFYGPPGTGKTTAIRALARKMYGSSHRSNVLELNASDERGIDTVRLIIKKFAETKSFSNNMKLIILDEADSMSRDAQNCMRRVIEDFSENARFCLIANYSTKIIPPIQSRCIKFRFSPVDDQKLIDKIQEICGIENIPYSVDAIKLLISMSQGDMRKLFNDIEGIKNGFGQINLENIYAICGGANQQVFSDLFEKLKIDCYKDLDINISAVKKAFSLDCESLIAHLSELTITSNLKNKMRILKILSDIQERLSIGCSQEIQTSALITTYILYR